jgi:DNA-binding NtrC family response regulator
MTGAGTNPLAANFSRLRILSVEDDPATQDLVATALRKHGATVHRTETVAAALNELATASGFDVVLVDLWLGDGDGLPIIRRARELHPSAHVIVISASGATHDVVEAMRAGASDFLPKPFDIAALGRAMERTLPEESSEPGGRERPRTSVDRPLLIGESPRTRELRDMIARVALVPTTVLVTGETGTGKEVVSRSIHGLSKRSGGPFVALNCGAIPENLIESELFGHARGAFTGASERRTGRFAQADGGTLFLDEIGELPLNMQVRLLRVLQDRQVTPVGDAKSVKVDVRVIAATNRDLPTMVREGRFREDLLFRLNVLHLRLPNLRERRDDIPVLFQHFLRRASMVAGRKVTLAPDGDAALLQHAWPGNVRELENFAERLVVLAGEGECSGDQVLALLHSSGEGPPMAGSGGSIVSMPAASTDMPESLGLLDSLERTERQLIDEALRRAGGNKAAAARLLGINRTTLIEKLKRRRD